MKIFIEDFRTGETLKRCSKCRQYKKLSEYRRNKSEARGVEAACKICRRRPRKFKDRTDWFWKTYWLKTVKVGDCLEWNGHYRNRLPSCVWKHKRTSLRRVVYSLACGDVPDNMFVVTTCNNPRCVRSSHLTLGNADTVEMKRANSAASGNRHGFRIHPETHVCGERHPRAKLTEQSVAEIRQAYKQGETTIAIAKSFGINRRYVYKVLNSQAWAHVQ